MTQEYYVYILTNKTKSVLYVGSTNDLERRLQEHALGKVGSFTKKYNVTCLLYYELHNSKDSSLKRESQIKKWNREWKLELIQKENIGLEDISEQLFNREE
ncbi:MAG: putative endonuclease [Candidatus Paceibacteria bacterium]|jgi:putative endonuclease